MLIDPPGVRNNCVLEAIILSTTNVIGTEQKLEIYRKGVFSFLMDKLSDLPLVAKQIVIKWSSSMGLNERESGTLYAHFK